jgi:hypothetical protein
VLWQNLAQKGLKGQFKFVGTLKSQFPCNGQYDLDHEGHVGYEAIGIANQDLLRGWLDKVKPVDIGMILLGTNDVVCITRDTLMRLPLTEFLVAG